MKKRNKMEIKQLSKNPEWISKILELNKKEKNKSSQSQANETNNSD